MLTYISGVIGELLIEVLCYVEILVEDVTFSANRVYGSLENE